MNSSKFICVIMVSNSWFEWFGSKKPFLRKNKNKKIISVAALKKVENNGDQKFIVITSQAIGNLKKIHNLVVHSEESNGTHFYSRRT